MWRPFGGVAPSRLPSHTPIMAEKHPKRPRDLNQWAKHMVDLATGEAQDIPPATKAEAASLGGKRRAELLPKNTRIEIARKAARKRWEPTR